MLRSFAILLLSGAALGQSSRPESAPASPFSRVVMIGASVTEGFLDGRKILDTAIRAPHAPIESFASRLFGMSAERFLEDQMKSAESADASLVIAMDAPFWFLYQSAPPGQACDRPLEAERKEPESTSKARLAMLEKGLALLARAKAPLVVGEIPDMHDAKRFIRPEQIPAPDTLRRANERIRAWAKERGNVLVLPLASWIEQLRKGTLALPPRFNGSVEERFPADLVLRSDRLHPSAVGQLLLAAWLTTALDEWMKPKESVFRLEPAELRRRIESVSK